MAKVRGLAPTWDALQRDRVVGPKLKVKQDPQGRTEARIDIRDRDVAKRMHEINDPWRKAETEHGAELSSRVPSVRMRDRHGREQVLPALDPNALRKKALAAGLHEAPCYRGARVPDDIVYRTLSCGHRLRLEVHQVGKRILPACGCPPQTVPAL